MLPLREVELESRKWLKGVNVRPGAAGLYPDFLIYAPGKGARMPDDADVKAMLYIVNALVSTAKADKFNPGNIKLQDHIFTMQISGKPESPDVKTQTKKFEQYYTSRSEVDERRLAKKISKVWEGISKGVFIPNDGHWKCKGCAYQKTSSCKRSLHQL